MKENELTEHQLKQISAYLDGELRPTEDAAVRSLIQESAVARSHYESLQQSRQLVRDNHRELLSSADPSSERLWSSIEASIQAEASRSWAAPIEAWWMKARDAFAVLRDPPIALGAAAFAVVLLSVVVTPSQSPQRDETRVAAAVVERSKLVGAPEAPQIVRVARLPEVEQRIRTHGAQVAWVRSGRSVSVVPGTEQRREQLPVLWVSHKR